MKSAIYPSKNFSSTHNGRENALFHRHCLNYTFDVYFIQTFFINALKLILSKLRIESLMVNQNTLPI